jgi:tetratricopeptide (TPR) repeat protein
VVVLETLIAFGRRTAQNARLAAGVFLVLLGSGCAALFPQTAQLRNSLPPNLPDVAELAAVPFYPQLDYQCGPAALATVLGATGVKVTPEQLVPEVYLPARKGSLQVEMLAAARRHGRVAYLLKPRFEDLLREVAAGNPVVVLQNLGLRESWHYAVVVGYNYDDANLFLRSGQNEREQMRFWEHEFVWARGGYWAMVALPPDRLPATVDESRYLASVTALERSDARAASVAYETFRKRWPDNVNAAVGLANTRHALGDLKSAEALLREAATRDPDSVIVLNNLAQTLSDQGRNAEALPFIDRALALGGPHADAVRDTRRAILQKLGRAD